MDGVAVSIILPVLNEADLNKKIDLLVPYINGYSYEIIVVDDSSDEKFMVLKDELGHRPGVRLIKGDRTGKGGAVRKAVLESTGSVVFYMDADFRIP